MFFQQFPHYLYFYPKIYLFTYLIFSCSPFPTSISNAALSSTQTANPAPILEWNSPALWNLYFYDHAFHPPYSIILCILSRFAYFSNHALPLWNSFKHPNHRALEPSSSTAPMSSTPLIAPWLLNAKRPSTILLPIPKSAAFRSHFPYSFIHTPFTSFIDVPGDG